MFLFTWLYDIIWFHRSLISIQFSLCRRFAVQPTTCCQFNVLHLSTKFVCAPTWRWHNMCNYLDTFAINWLINTRTVIKRDGDTKLPRSTWNIVFVYDKLMLMPNKWQFCSFIRHLRAISFTLSQRISQWLIQGKPENIWRVPYTTLIIMNNWWM